MNALTTLLLELDKVIAQTNKEWFAPLSPAHQEDGELLPAETGTERNTIVLDNLQGALVHALVNSLQAHEVDMFVRYTVAVAAERKETVVCVPS